VRPEALEERRKRLRKLLARSNKALRDDIQLSEALTGDGAAIFRHPRPISRHTGSRCVSGRTRALV
jgi:ATP-dependent DNA ligase